MYRTGGHNNDGSLLYRSIVSCLTPLGKVHGKHIVTVEGINMDNLSPVQNAIVEENATQCGFCTPGFVVSLTGFTMSPGKPDMKKAVESISGNICRCTGYKSIERAAEKITDLIKDKIVNDPVGWLVREHFLPHYFLGIKERLEKITVQDIDHTPDCLIVGGGTDLMVSAPEKVRGADISFLHLLKAKKGVQIVNDKCIVGAATTISEVSESEAMNNLIPDLKDIMKLIASEPIRNMGTIGGNIVNASPIGDLTIIFLALGSDLTISTGKKVRNVALEDFFLGYKSIDLKKGEILDSITFRANKSPLLFNFEKVSKRTHLDIASVNSAMSAEVDGDIIRSCIISAGGVGPVPLVLRSASGLLKNKRIEVSLLSDLFLHLDKDISPISDIRGTKDYKSLLLRNLIVSHFMKLFRNHLNDNELKSLLTENLMTSQ